MCLIVVPLLPGKNPFAVLIIIIIIIITIIIIIIIIIINPWKCRLCGLVVRVPGYRPLGPGSIPGATRLSAK
jgi:hypothetical protein